MTDRIKGLTVTLRDELRDDDAQPIIDAIKLLHGVVDVRAHVSQPDHHMAKMQVREEIRENVLNLYKSI